MLSILLNLGRVGFLRYMGIARIATPLISCSSLGLVPEMVIDVATRSEIAIICEKKRKRAAVELGFRAGYFQGFGTVVFKCVWMFCFGAVSCN